MLSNAYNLVLHKHGDLLYNGVRDTILEHLTETSRPVLQAPDDALLSRLCALWADHRVSMEMIRDILMYLVSVHVCVRAREAALPDRTRARRTARTCRSTERCLCSTWG